MTDPQTNTSTTEVPVSNPAPVTEQSADKQPKTDLIPKSTMTGRNWEDNTYYSGVLIAERKPNSLDLNSVGPLWILEITDADEQLNGTIIRTFENPGPDVQPGNPGDQTPRLWFKIQKMLRPDRIRIDVATDLRNSPPEPEA